jgi:hypothetical protein
VKALSPVLPLGSESRTCSKATECFISYDLFSLDNHPEPRPGDQVYCATGTGVVGGTVLGPTPRARRTQASDSRRPLRARRRRRDPSRLA